MTDLTNATSLTSTSASTTNASPASSGHVVTMLRMRVRAGGEDEFARNWELAATTIADASGQVSQELFRDVEDPQAFLVVATWSDQDSLELFGRSGHRERLTAALRDLRESAERHTYHSLLTVPGRDGR